MLSVFKTVSKSLPKDFKSKVLDSFIKDIDDNSAKIILCEGNNQNKPYKKVLAVSKLDSKNKHSEIQYLDADLAKDQRNIDKSILSLYKPLRNPFDADYIRYVQARMNFVDQLFDHRVGSYTSKLLDDQVISCNSIISELRVCNYKSSTANDMLVENQLNRNTKLFPYLPCKTIPIELLEDIDSEKLSIGSLPQFQASTLYFIYGKILGINVSLPAFAGSRSDLFLDYKNDSIHVDFKYFSAGYVMNQIGKSTFEHSVLIEPHSGSRYLNSKKLITFVSQL